VDWVAEHTRTYLASGDTEGHESNGVRTLVLATTGRRTDTPRRTCLIYGTSDGEYVVAASKGGAEQDPAWFKNLEADPSAGVQVGTRRFTARAGVASSAERAPLWAQMVDIFPLYDDYAHKTDREIPIVLLTPLDGPRYWGDQVDRQPRDLVVTLLAATAPTWSRPSPCTAQRARRIPRPDSGHGGGRQPPPAPRRRSPRREQDIHRSLVWFVAEPQPQLTVEPFEAAELRVLQRRADIAERADHRVDLGVGSRPTC
jgi:deazaflavin-dependent oxidoreductase (nitroreductase family)